MKGELSLLVVCGVSDKLSHLFICTKGIVVRITTPLKVALHVLSYLSTSQGKVSGKDIWIGVGEFDIHAWGIVPSEIPPEIVFIYPSEYSRKYSVPKQRVLRMFGYHQVPRITLLNGEKGRKVTLVADVVPSPQMGKLVRRGRNYYYSQDYIAKMDKKVEHIGTPLSVKFVKIVVKGTVTVGELHCFAREGRLFRIGKFYYYLYNPFGKHLDDVKANYPDPTPLIFPKPQIKVDWDKITPVDADTVKSIYFRKYAWKKTRRVEQV